MSSHLSEPEKLLRQILELANRMGASDIHLSQDQPPYFRTAGELVPAADEMAPTLAAAELEGLLDRLLGEKQRQSFTSRGSADGAFSLDAESRFRFNFFRCNDNISLTLRKLDNRFRPLSDLGLSDDLYRLCDLKDGLVLVAGPTGSGKSTTLATLIDQINRQRKCHIVTIEDPIEYLHHNQQSVVSQRQVGTDTSSFAEALVDALRQDPDVILVGELRDLPTIRTAVMAAETGHLVFGTVHSGDCVSAIERITSVFPGNEQEMINQMLAMSLRAVLAQHLVLASPRRGYGESNPDVRPSQNRVLASELMIVNSAIANLIANRKLVQIRSVLETGRSEGMYTLDSCLARLLRENRISTTVAKKFARNPAMLGELARAV